MTVDLAAAIERLRLRLLDLGGRNRLLNFRHTKKNSIRFVDEVPDFLFTQLLEGTEFTISALPISRAQAERKFGPESDGAQLGIEVTEAPGRETAERVAKRYSIPTEFELPAVVDSSNSRHTDRALQTILFPEDLGSLLRKTLSEAELAVQETGSNMLYLAFGFLEWYESDSSSSPRLAPLMLLPVSLSRGEVDSRTREFRYKLQHSGEEPEINLSLRERLKRDFALELPTFGSDDSLSDYFADVRQLCATRQRWQVHTYASLALFSFGKILMYRDLADESWPKDCKPSAHPRVRELLEGVERQPADDWADEYDVDSPAMAEHVPLTVDEADGSQLSALADVQRGKNLVIEGPPGTGKSQTIANLIAAALQGGKTVLFVAEKLAALEVVRHRLNKVGLGDFCLELHSHKTKKRQVLDDIEERLERRRRNFDEARYLSARRQLNDKKRKLRQYSDLLHKQLEPLGMTLFDAMWGIEGLRTSLGSACTSLDELAFPHADRVSESDLRDYSQRAENFEAKLGEVLATSDSISEHPWWGTSNYRLTFLDRQSAERVVDDFGKSAAELVVGCNKIALLSKKTLCPDTFADVSTLLAATRSSPAPSTEIGKKLGALALEAGSALETAHAYRTDFEHYCRIQASAGKLFANPAEVTHDRLNSLESQHRGLSAGEATAVRDVIAAGHRWRQAAQDLSAGVAAVASVAEVLNCSVEASAGGAQLLSEVRHIVEAFPLDGFQVRTGMLRKPGTRSAILKLRDRRDAVVDVEQKLSAVYDVSSLLPGEVQSHLKVASGSSWWEAFGGQQRAAKRFIREKSRGALRPSLGQATRELSALDRYLQEKSAIAASPFWDALGVPVVNINDYDFSAAIAFIGWYEDAVARLRKYDQAGAAILDRLWLSPESWIGGARRRMQESGGAIELASIAESILGGDTLAGGWPDSPSWTDKARSALHYADRAAAFEMASHSLSLHEHLPYNEVPQAVSRGRDLVGAVTVLSRHSAFERLRSDAELNDEQWHAVCLETLGYLVGTGSAGVYAEPLRRMVVEQGWEAEAQLRAVLENLSNVLAEFESALHEVERKLGVSPAPWFAAPSGIAQKTSLAYIAASASRACGSGSLVAWCDYLKARNQFALAGCEPLARLVESGVLVRGKVSSATKYVLLRSRVRIAFSESSELESFATNSRDQLREQFSELDRQMLDLTRTAAAYAASRRRVPEGQSVGRVGDLSELSLLDHERAKQRRHIPLRQLMRRAGGAIVALKPCFMMGPLSVAQYLAPGGLKFDLVVMDEASQLKTEDALGALLRGSQLVVVGDRMQLPPTSFFEKVGEESSDVPDEESDLASQSQSILEAAASVYRPARMLKWHYRSRHASLISFSNVHFYRSKLIALPPTAPTSPDAGVRLVEVSEGCYEHSTNLAEARRLVDAVVACILSRPQDSIGVATMNAAQAEVISELFEQRMKSSEEVRRYVENQQASLEPFFVKNLENVQGDERDVIFVSITYGRGRDGRVLQRFGPINGAYGHRRLNVLFTRARRRLILFSSMGAEDVLVGPDSGLGVRTLRDYLKFARTGILAGSQLTGRPPDSDFEVAVAEALRAHGYDVAAQVGSAGYFIDLAVRSRRNHEIFLLAIECDGKTYHSTRSARDRDRLRQQILEGLGWRVHRIWSTDWFRQPEHELARILRELERLEREEAEHSARWTPGVDPVLETAESLEDSAAESETLTSVAPTGLSEEEARVQLLELAEQTRRTTPTDVGALEFLREQMIDALIRYRPNSRDEFLGRVPFDLRVDSAGEQIRQSLDAALAIVRSLPRR